VQRAIVERILGALEVFERILGTVEVRGEHGGDQPAVPGSVQR
jgi:hypothetical protein